VVSITPPAQQASSPSAAAAAAVSSSYSPPSSPAAIQHELQQQPPQQLRHPLQVSQYVVQPQPHQVQAECEMRVSLPSGVQPGQTVMFNTPNGQSMSIVASETVPPGGQLALRMGGYPISTMNVSMDQSSMEAMNAPLLPTPTVEGGGQDKKVAKWWWASYAAACFCACCCGAWPLAILVWAGVGIFQYCKATEVRSRQPLRTKVAKVSLITAAIPVCCFVFCLCPLALIGVALCEGDLDNCPDAIARWSNITHMAHGAPVTLQGFYCDNGFGSENNQVYLYKGKKEGRPYYQGQTATNKYIYYDSHCSSDTAAPGWFVGAHPEHPANQKHCVNDAHIESTDFFLPSGEHTWNWVWCGKNGSKDTKLWTGVLSKHGGWGTFLPRKQSFDVDDDDIDIDVDADEE